MAAWTFINGFGTHRWCFAVSECLGRIAAHFYEPPPKISIGYQRAVRHRL